MERSFLNLIRKAQSRYLEMKGGAEAPDGLVPDPNHDTVINISSDEYEDDDDFVDDSGSKEGFPEGFPEERSTYFEPDLKVETFRAQIQHSRNLANDHTFTPSQKAVKSKNDRELLAGYQNEQNRGGKRHWKNKTAGVSKRKSSGARPSIANSISRPGQDSKSLSTRAIGVMPT